MRPQADPLAGLLAAAFDPEGGEVLSALGGEPLAVVDAGEAGTLASLSGELRTGAPILVGVDAEGRLPEALPDLFDILLTSADRPPAPWVGVGREGMAKAISDLRATVRACPVAAAVFATVLKLGDSLDFDGALAVESLAYSALLGGREFRAWREARPARARMANDAPPLRLERRDDAMVITLSRPEARNPIGARMRDELTGALRLVRLDPSMTRVELRGEGPCFSAGGDLDEFGQAQDLALAHVIRTQRSVARLAREIGARLTVFVQGAAVGGGIEIAAAVETVVADPAAVFRLPEVGMGLIPGAGGTASLPRRIGRHRTCFMGLSGRDISAEQALDWGLVDRLEPVP
jgi:enoyl-CoA hydratase/carnithine racemase